MSIPYNNLQISALLVCPFVLKLLVLPGFASRLHFRRNCSFDRLIHLRVSRTAAEIAAQRVANVFFTRLGILIEQRFYRHHEARSAIAALCATPVAVGFLDGGQRSVFRDAFHSGDLGSAVLVCGTTHGQQGAAQRRHSVYQNSAVAAGGTIASAL